MSNMPFSINIQNFIIQIFKEETPIFKFLKENTIKMVFSNNKLHCNKEEFIKAFNHFCGTDNCWGSISKNFNNYRIRISHDGIRDGFITFLFPDSFSLDEILNRREIMHLCDVSGCGYRGTVKNLREHKCTHIEKQDFPCEVPGCGYRGLTRSKLFLHMRIHNIKRSFDCPVADCGYKTITDSRLRLHLLRHTNNGSYPCDVPGCSYVGKMHRNLKNHMRSHKKYKEFSCEIAGCGRVFGIKMTLVNHMRLEHKDPLEDIEKPLKNIEKPLEDIEKPLEDIEKPLEGIKKPIELSILHHPDIAKILEAKLPVPKDDDIIEEEKPKDEVIDVDDQSTVVDDDATVVDDDATVVDDDVTLLSS